jgi:hypothetical protein
MACLGVLRQLGADRVGPAMIRRVGTVAAVVFVACLLIAGLVAIALRSSVSDAVVVGLVSGVLGSGVTGVATLLAVRQTMEGQRELDRKAREFERHALAVDRRRAAFRQLLVASDYLKDAVWEVRLYPQGRPRTNPDQRDFDPSAAVNEAVAEAKAAYRAAEPDLRLDLGAKADRVLDAYDELWQAYAKFRVVALNNEGAEEELEAYDRAQAAWQKLRTETHLELPKPGTEDWPDLPPLV